MDGCDYDICEECHSHKYPGDGVASGEGDLADSGSGDAQASSSSFLALQQEQERATTQNQGRSFGLAHLDDVETRPYYTEVECHAFLQSYSRLFHVPGSAQNKKILCLDELLTQVLYGSGQVEPTEVHQKKALSLLLNRMKLSHKIGTTKLPCLVPLAQSAIGANVNQNTRIVCICDELFRRRPCSKEGCW